MNSKEASKKADQVTYVIGVAIRGPITSGDYYVGKAKINVSYPPKVDFGFPTPIELLKGLSTVFEVTWPDKGGATAKQLYSKGAERHRPVHYALDKINELLLAYKLVRVGHADGIGIRTVGIGDRDMVESCGSKISRKTWCTFPSSNRTRKPTQQRRLRKDTPMHRVHHDEAAREQLSLDLDEIARQGARKMLA